MNKNNNQENKPNSKKFKWNQKTILIAAVALTALVAICLGVWYFMGEVQKNPGVLNKDAAERDITKGVSISVVPRTGAMTVVTTSTDLVYLGDLLEEQNLVKPEHNNNGVVHTINGIKVDSAENAFWKLYVDGEAVSTGIYDTKLQDGKHYRLEYTIGS